jgi:hypothetical protein
MTQKEKPPLRLLLNAFISICYLSSSLAQRLAAQPLGHLRFVVTILA